MGILSLLTDKIHKKSEKQKRQNEQELAQLNSTLQHDKTRLTQALKSFEELGEAINQGDSERALKICDKFRTKNDNNSR